jgi:NADH:ubiquinone oxidoreductase subunit 5 (subunit L)/multisubunit Na+/H+ antiporter MnhA subunit
MILYIDYLETSIFILIISADFFFLFLFFEIISIILFLLISFTVVRGRLKRDLSINYSILMAALSLRKL